MFLAHLLTRDEKLTPRRLAGVLLGVGGVALIVGPQALRGAGGELRGELAVLAAAACDALAGIWGRRFRDLAPPVTACGMLIASSLLMVPAALLVERPWRLAPSPETLAASLAAVAAVAVFGTAGAYLLYFRILRSAGATNLLLVTLLIPVGALAVGVLLLGEPLEPRALGVAAKEVVPGDA